MRTLITLNQGKINLPSVDEKGCKRGKNVDVIYKQ